MRPLGDLAMTVSLIAMPTHDPDDRQEPVLTLYVGAAITGAEIP
jgi:hypothetical protein